MVDLPASGLCGGYLVLNRSGRPLEFHCSAPVKPNRAQQILYGPTLEPFLYGEQIGQALLARAREGVVLVYTDRLPVLAVREFVTLPVALVCGSSSDAGGDGTAANSRGAVRGGAPLITFRIGDNELAVPAEAAEDQRQIIERMADLGVNFDLAEPFQRIREALEEAQRGARAAA